MPHRLARRRIDHHPMYLAPIAGLLIISLAILTHLGVHPAHERLNTGASDLFAAVLGIGSSACLAGAASGTRWFRPNADLRDSYHWQSWWLMPTTVAALVFNIAIFYTGPRLENIEVVILISSLIVGLLLFARELQLQSRRITAELVHRIGSRSS